MKLTKFFKKKTKPEAEVQLERILCKVSFLLQSPIFRNQQQMSTKLAFRMIQKVIERDI
jgi:hypothetical protein